MLPHIKATRKKPYWYINRPKRPSQPSLGQRPGHVAAAVKALKERYNRLPRNASLLQSFKAMWFDDPGRCPGLGCVGPCDQKNRSRLIHYGLTDEEIAIVEEATK